MISESEAVARLTADPHSAVLATDFDGSLSEIVDDPAEARPYPGVLPTISDLAGAFHLVAVVSGRPATFLMDRLALQTMPSNVVAYGIYGREEVTSARTIEYGDDEAAARRLIAAFLADADEAGLGAHAEPKGSSVTFHWRTSRELAEVLTEFAQREARLLGLELRHGRLSVELVAPGSPDKGSVVRALGRGARTVSFLGDDLGDLAAFDALDDLAQSGAATLRVAVRSPEIPPALLERADLVVDGPSGAADFLAALARALAAH